MTRDHSTIPDVLLERYRLGELPPNETASVAARAAEPAVRQRLDAVAQSDTSIRSGDAIRQLASAAAARLARGRGTLGVAWRWSAVAGAAAVLAAVAILSPAEGWRFWPPSARAPGHDPSGPDRIKGDDATLLVFRKAGTASERLTDGDAARAGDLVRIGYRASKRLYGVIVSIDGRGVVTRHMPTAGAAAVPLQPGEVVPLANAYELDDAPLWERFFLVTSTAAFDAESVAAAARRAAAEGSRGGEAPATLPLPASFDQASFLLRKTP